MNILKIRSPAVIVFVALACTPSCADCERYEFLGGATICGDKDRVVRQYLSGVFGGGDKLESIFVRLDSTEIQLTPDVLLNDDHYRDIATFMETHPESVGSDANGDFLKVDVSFRPSAEVDSMRLIDSLLPGDGAMWFIVSESLHDLEPDPPDGRLAEIFLALCWADTPKGPLCERRFPISGFRAEYLLPDHWEGVFERDREIRSRLEAWVKPCD